MTIRKDVSGLTQDDLEMFPVWEFALDEEGEEGQDEAKVRPYEISGALDPSDGMFIVRAAFTLADGSKMRGYLTPGVQGDESLGALQPVIITELGQVFFWYGMLSPGAQSLAQSYEMHGRDAAEVFPVQAASDVELVSAPICATIPGFMVLKDFRTGETRIVK
jgi:hypothetical protein